MEYYVYEIEVKRAKFNMWIQGMMHELILPSRQSYLTLTR